MYLLLGRLWKYLEMKSTFGFTEALFPCWKILILRPLFLIHQVFTVTYTQTDEFRKMAALKVFWMQIVSLCSFFGIFLFTGRAVLFKLSIMHHEWNNKYCIDCRFSACPGPAIAENNFASHQDCASICLPNRSRNIQICIKNCTVRFIPFIKLEF